MHFIMTTQGRPGARLPLDAARIVAVALTYVVAAKLGLSLATVGVTVSLVWPASGVAVAAVLLFGERMLVGVALGAFIANVTTPVPLGLVAAATIGNTLEALVASRLLRRAGFNLRIQRVRDVFSLAVYGAALPSIAAATFGSAGLVLTGRFPWSDFPRTWGTWWAGDAVGILLVTPVALAWLSRPLPPLPLRRAVELAALSTSGALLSLLLFTGILPGSATAPLAFVVFPLLLWAALSYGQRGAATGALVTSVIAVLWTARGLGPFARESLVGSLIYLNSFIVVAMLASVTVAAVMSERRHATARVRDRESRLRAILAGLPAVVWTTDPELRITSCQGALLGTLNLRADELIGTSIMERIDAPDGPVAVAHRRALAGEANSYRSARDGRTFSGHVEPLRSGAGEIIGTIGVALEVTEQEAVERRYGDLVEHAPIGIYRARADGKFLVVNEALVTMLGYPSAADLLRLDPAADVYEDPSELAWRLGVKHDDGLVDRREVKWRRRDGRVITVQLQGRPLRDAQGRYEFEMIAQDVTERRVLEKQLLQSQKMEAVGRLAGGVAHDFNNVLTVILGGLHFLRQDLVPDHDQTTMISEIEQAAFRAQGLTHRLLAFSRRQMMEPRLIDLNTLVGSVESMLRRVIGEDIELQVALGAGLHAVKADPGQLEQAIVNLVVNSRDAMPEGGRVTIETRNVQLAPSAEEDDEIPTGGPHVLLAVTDTGCGMAPEVRAHLFEPFFTTKPLGKGTGLGLPMVYGIVKQSDGLITVESEPGQGTAIKIYFPSAGPRAEPAPVTRAAMARSQGDETILLAEDDDGVRHWIHNALQGQGYTVFACRHAREALGIAEQYAGTIHLLLTDVVMPGMNGRELADRLVAARPATRVLYMSGYTEEALDRHGVPGGGTTRGFIQKPFTPVELLEKVRAMLDRARDVRSVAQAGREGMDVRKP
jgi:PAS domain S-box-containing protein